MLRHLFISLLALGLVGATSACGDDDKKQTPPVDPNPEPQPNPEPAPNPDPDPSMMFTGDYADTKATDVDEEMALPGLTYPVHVTSDEFGVPHILAESIEDAVLTQGYIHARDRLAQMELIRGTTRGRIARVAGGLDPGTIDDDIEQRIMGFGRVAEEIYADMPDSSPSKRLIDAYTKGVNIFIQRFRDGDVRLPNEVLLLVSQGKILDWTPIDSLSIVRIQQHQLSFDAEREVRITRSFRAAKDTFPADSPDPALAARAGLFEDLHRFAPADPAYQIPGFTAPRDKNGQGSESPDVPLAARITPKAATLDIASGFLKKQHSEIYRRLLPGNKGMSNSWAVSGTLTDSGNAMIANDPHLSLDSPALFHEVHMVVEPRTDTDGPALNVFGAQFPGLPGILIGHNANVAWALTTASYDYTDAFREQLVWRDGEEWPRVLHNGEEVELEIVQDQVEAAGGGFGGDLEVIPFEYAIVPHTRGPLALTVEGGVVQKPEGDEAISFAWRGFSASNEIKAILGMMTATNVGEAETALDDWVIGSQNMLFADLEGNIFTTGKSFVPRRPAAAMTWDPVDNPEGQAPWFVLSGTGEHDWEGQLDFEQVPNVLNPESGFIVTANNDQTGMTDDGNPLNDPHPYLGYDYDLGFRAGRIERMLTNADNNREGKITIEDMFAYQNDFRSDNDERIAPFMIESIGFALDAIANPGTNPELDAILAEHPDSQDRLTTYRDMLANWDFIAHDGLTNDPTDDDRARARATSLFNFWQTAIIKGAFDDERSAAQGFSPTGQQISKGLIFLLERPSDAATFDPDTGQSALWDNLTTPDAKESRDAIVLTALFEAESQLTAAFESNDPNTWIWGLRHHRTFSSIIPSLAPGVPHAFTWPQPDEGFATTGFPTPGDNYNVNVCNGGVTDFGYRCGGGAILRLIVELDPDGIRSFNAMPGGQVWDKDSDHFRDQLDIWLAGERKANPFHPADVVAAVEDHTLFNP